MLKIANDAQNLKNGDREKAIDVALTNLKEDYERHNVHGDIDMDNIDWSKVKVIKENE